jgi:hypothetical protein
LGSTCIPVVKRIAFQSHAHSDSNALEWVGKKINV